MESPHTQVRPGHPLLPFTADAPSPAPSTSTSSNDVYAGDALIPRDARLLNLVLGTGFAPPPASADVGVGAATNGTASTWLVLWEPPAVPSALPVDGAVGPDVVIRTAVTPAGARLLVRFPDVCAAIHQGIE